MVLLTNLLRLCDPYRGECLTVQNIDDQAITWFRALDGNRTREIMNLGEIDIPDIVTAYSQSNSK